MLTPTTIAHLETFTRPAVDSGLIPKAELREAVRILIKATKPEPEAQRRSPKLIPASETAKLLGCCRETVLRMHRQGILHGVQLIPGNHKSLRFRTRDIEKLTIAE